ncbi:hypothetical protein [Kineococcus rhizosphaerae]|uniref:Uncharacterized protein n=1 Tax=Kineococcus rhizosphaerae TaxID=559628 RepID=A0A2T0R2Z2_9ACTN|nr:hypothetical protein [Kineococcus rhizosphaerae]PRY14178.1 hypothetical protein CLV37_107298 [Kineococcus rhizosphaerae]
MLRSDGWAGSAAYLVGLTGPVDDLAGWLLARAFAAGAEFAHTHQPVAGFTRVDGLDVHVDV